MANEETLAPTTGDEVARGIGEAIGLGLLDNHLDEIEYSVKARRILMNGDKMPTIPPPDGQKWVWDDRGAWVLLTLDDQNPMTEAEVEQMLDAVYHKGRGVA